MDETELAAVRKKTQTGTGRGTAADRKWRIRTAQCCAASADLLWRSGRNISGIRKKISVPALRFTLEIERIHNIIIKKCIDHFRKS